MKVTVTFELKTPLGDEHMNEIISPAWPGRWLDMAREGANQPQIDAALEALTRIEDSFPHPRAPESNAQMHAEKARITSALDHTLLDEVWASPDALNIRYELSHEEYYDCLPDELIDICKTYIERGPHHVIVERWRLRLLAKLLWPIANVQADECNYELGVMCNSLYGVVY